MEQHPLAEGAYFGRLMVALMLGVGIGLEREWRQRTAGLHTTAMVAVGAAIFAMIAPLLETKDADPTRIAAQVVSGIGFLAGGVILRQGLNVRGLTTAGTLWATSAVGVLTGFGFFVQATGAAIAIVITNTLLYPVTRYVDSMARDTSDVMTTYTLDIACSRASEALVRDRLIESVNRTPISLVSMESSTLSEIDVLVRAQLSRQGRDDRTIERLAADLKVIAGVISVQWQAAVAYE